MTPNDALKTTRRRLRPKISVKWASARRHMLSGIDFVEFPRTAQSTRSPSLGEQG
ncbi:hypothetical protein WN55_09747 [Dufourea novaeangliae]|uniref:Uncharacterized protein n=1 Tax=Dufourea novaeangliae TaxID=178035 RepID=A0A154P127_DUFNO|nr:hypothetical protein WN55_09747 [Dufourea novaeangliae]